MPNKDVNAFDLIAQSVQKEKGKKPYQRPDTSVTTSVTMSKEERERFTKFAKEHGMSLSGLLRFATITYIKTHNLD